MDKSEKGSTPSTARDAISALSLGDQDLLLRYVYKTAENLVLEDTTLRNASQDLVTRAEHIAQEALCYLIRWTRVKPWTLRDLQRVAAWKARKLVANQRVLAYRETQHTVSAEDLVVELHYDDEASHEEHGPSFKARAQAPAAEHVGRNPEERSEEFLTDLLWEVELFLKNETRMPSTSIAKVLALLECWWRNEDEALKITESGNVVQQESWLAKRLGWTIEDVRKTRKRMVERSEALRAWLKARGRADLLRTIPHR